ncbi:helix-turn-helix domain-containing protein [Clostridium thailandense]
MSTQNGNQTKAAESLKISRTTLWRLIKSVL